MGCTPSTPAKKSRKPTASISTPVARPIAVSKAASTSSNSLQNPKYSISTAEGARSVRTSEARVKSSSIFARISMNRSEKRRVLIVGTEGVGKTTVLNVLCNRSAASFSPPLPTEGFNAEIVMVNRMELTIWDVGGKSRSLWMHYYVGVHGLVYVVDNSLPERCEEVKSVMREVMANEQLRSACVLFLLNKQDKNADVDVYKNAIEEVMEEDRRKYAICACSALRQENVKESFAWLCDVMNDDDDNRNARSR